MSRGRLAALAVVLVGLGLYDSQHLRLWHASSVWWDIAFLAGVLIPVSFAVTWLLVPARFMRGVLPVALALAALAYGFRAAGFHTPENVFKLVAVTLAGFWFLRYFEAAAWVVLIALIIPWVDAYSVWRGPTKEIVTNHPHVFGALSYGLPTPGHHSGAQLGVPDVLFFALFFAASVRFGLRPAWTWLALTASLGATFAITVWADLSGLPALPGLSLGFLLPNADLLWMKVRREAKGGPSRAGEAVGRPPRDSAG